LRGCVVQRYVQYRALIDKILENEAILLRQRYSKEQSHTKHDDIHPGDEHTTTEASEKALATAE
jgi:hypothetical protein